MSIYPRVEAEYDKAKSTPSDISEHVQTLHDLARECNSVVEAGVRYVVSTWAFIYGCACRGGIVNSYCWNILPEIQKAVALCRAEGVKWKFHEGDWLQIEIPKCDLLFIDTNHFYSQLTEELRLHSNKSRKYIVLHDTTSCGEVGADGKRPGLWQAVEEFVAEDNWYVQKRYTNRHGLTILKRTRTTDEDT